MQNFSELSPFLQLKLHLQQLFSFQLDFYEYFNTRIQKIITKIFNKVINKNI